MNEPVEHEITQGVISRYPFAPVSHEELLAIDARIKALEQLTSWVNDVTPTDETARKLAELQRVILWVLKQPWERDIATWDELVAMVDKQPAPALKFRETVVTPPPVRDVL